MGKDLGVTMDFYDDDSFQKPEVYNYNTKLKHSQKLQGFLIEVLTEKLEKKSFKVHWYICLCSEKYA